MSQTSTRCSNPRTNVAHQLNALAGNSTTVISFGAALLTNASNAAGATDVSKRSNPLWKQLSSGEKLFEPMPNIIGMHSSQENKEILSIEAGTYNKKKKRVALRSSSKTSAEWNLMMNETSRQVDDAEAGSYVAALDGYVEQLESMSWEDSSASVLQIVSDMMIEVNSATMIEDSMEVDQHNGVTNSDRQLLNLIAEEKRQIRCIVEDYVNSFKQLPSRNEYSWSNDRSQSKHGRSDSMSDHENTAEITRDLYAQLDC